ncbi:MAG TPA: hypothetical protein VIL12_03590 [Acidimicrobiia bacterium]
MNRWLLCGALVVGSAMATNPASASEELTVEQLLADPGAMAGQDISLEGELVGDYGARPDGSLWTQLNDDPYARHPTDEGGSLAGSNLGIAIAGPAALFENLDPPGRHDRRGPLVRAQGTWVYHDPGRGGESYLDVRSLEPLEPGRELGRRFSSETLIAGLVLLAAAGMMAALLRRRQRRAF